MKLNDAVVKVYAFFKQLKAKPVASATETTPASTAAQTAASATATKPAKKPKSKLRRTLEPIALALAAILCFTYPVASTLWNNKVSKEISTAYDRLNRKQIASAREKILNAARRYNARHKSIITADPYNGTTDYMKTPEYKEYAKQLDEPMGIMGIVKIPKIGVKLPIYHGSSQEVLAYGAGHLYGTDLPVGG